MPPSSHPQLCRHDWHAADAWLQQLCKRDGAWRDLLALLCLPDATPGEHFFAATALRPLCQRHEKAVVQPDTAPAVAQALSEQYVAAAAAGSWHTANQLAAALAAIAVRAPSWPEPQIVPQMLALLLATQQQQQQLAQALHLLTALAEAACSPATGMHPQRRATAMDALAAAPELLAAVQQALDLGGDGAATPEQLAALQLLQAWCTLGPPPAGAEHATALLQQLHQAVLHPQLSSVAAEAVAALYATCCPPEGGGPGADPQAGRRAALLAALLRILPAFFSALQQALAHPHTVPQQAQLLFAALAVLGAAARAADSHGQQEAGAAAVQLAAGVALAALQHSQLEVALAALQHFDEQLERWAALGDGGACSPQQRQALLEALCGALLQRMTLPAHLPPASVTADARDLPDSVRLVSGAARPCVELRSVARCLARLALLLRSSPGLACCPRSAAAGAP